MPFVVSTAGVLCRPTGSWMPQLTSAFRAGVPTLVNHCTAPVVASSEYTVLATVATMTREPTTSGSALMSSFHALLSRWIDVHCGDTPLNAAVTVSLPARVASRWYVGQSVDAAIAIGDPRITVATISARPASRC